MISSLIAKYYEKVIYRLPKEPALPWFSVQYTQQDKSIALGMLKQLIVECGCSYNKVVVRAIELISEIIFSMPQPYDKISPVDLSLGMAQLSEYQRNDFLVLALFLTLSSTQDIRVRVSVLLKHWKHFNVSDIIESVLQSLMKDEVSMIKKPHMLGEGYQNKMARLNGIKTCGWFGYRQQIFSMINNQPLASLKKKFDFLNHLDSSTLGGALRDLLRSGQLSLPGEPGGFAEFFLWHDISHVISGNNTDFSGELGANAFTAGFVERCKFRVLLFGLLQFNLGVPLAIVAATSKNQFENEDTIKVYLHSLISGSESKLNLLNWPVEVMIHDLKTDLNLVQEKYNIKPVPKAV